MAISVVLGIGDDASDDFIELAGTSKTDPYIILENGLLIPDPPMNAQYAEGVARHGADLGLFSYGNRQISMQLIVTGTSTTDLNYNVEQINRFLDLARDQSITGETQPIVLTVRLSEDDPPMYFDILNGQLDSQEMTLRFTNYMGQYVLNLVAYPFARGAGVLLDESSEIDNDHVAIYDITGVPGQVPALAQIRIKDTSASGNINRVRVAIRTEDQGGDPENTVFGHVLTLVSGSSQSETDSLNGSNVIRATSAGGTLTSDWSTLGRVQKNTNLTENSGIFRAFLRVRDNTLLPPPAMRQAGRRSGGTLTVNTTYYYCVTAINGSGGETGASSVISYTTSSSTYRTIQVQWYSVAEAAKYRIYRSTTGADGSWAYYEKTTTAQGVITHDDAGAFSYTTGDPPAEGTALNSSGLFRLRYGFYSDPDENMQTTPALGGGTGGNFEIVDMGLIRIPPRPLPAGIASPGWKIEAQARATTSSGGSIDIDGLYLIPYSGYFAEAWYPTLNLATSYKWIIEQTNNEQISAILTDASTNAVIGPVSVKGETLFSPGKNRVFVMANKITNTHEVSNTSFTVQVYYVPRYLQIPH